MLKKTKGEKVWMYHESCPKGRIFDRSKIEELKEWVDTPAKLKTKPVEAVEESKVKRMQPGELVELVKKLGYKVLTDIELQAEIGKSQDGFDISKVSDDELIVEAEKRGLKESPEKAPSQENIALDKLEERFMDKPTGLIKEELLQLGNVRYGIGLRSNMKESTLIEKITASMNR